MTSQADPPAIAGDLVAALEQVAVRQKYSRPDDPRDVSGTRLWFEEFTNLVSQRSSRYLVETRDVQLPDEPRKVAARIYHSPVQRARILFVHGGGWVLGSLNSHDSICRWLSHETSSEVIAVDYDLAPEHPFPRAVDQTLSALHSAIAMSAKDVLPLLVMGDSAGATIAGLAMLRLEHHDLVKICGFVSAYGAFVPQLDRHSHIRFADGPFLRRSEMQLYWRYFSGQPAGEANSHLTPLDYSLKGFPPTLSLAMECDLLCDDSVALHEKIVGDGGTSTLDHWRGLPHGCLHFAGIVPSVTRSAQSIVRFIAMSTTVPK